MSPEKDGQQRAGDGDADSRGQQLQDNFQQRRFKVARRQGNAQVNGRQPQAEEQAGKGQGFQSHLDLGARPDKDDQKWIGNGHGGYGDTG